MFLFVTQEKAHHSVTRLCRLLGVSTAGIMRGGAEGHLPEPGVTPSWWHGSNTCTGSAEASTEHPESMPS